MTTKNSLAARYVIQPP